MASPAVLLEFYPRFKRTKVTCEFVFLVNRNENTCANYINSARETLIDFLNVLPLNCHFNIAGGRSSCSYLFPTSVPTTEKNLYQALWHAQQMEEDLGGPSLLDLLKFVLQQEHLEPGLPRQLFVLTNGSVHDINSCISEVEKNAHIAR